MHPVLPRFAVLLSAIVLVACESTSGTKETDESATPPADSSATTSGSTSSSTGSTTGLGSSSTFQGHPLDNPASTLSNRTIYFEFDSSEIASTDREVIDAHAQYLASNPGASITLEGHADERGSREYNIALGERRANAVRQLMTLIGAGGQQIRTLSYGEERPAADGHDESAWALNRRVEIIYRTRN